MPSKEMQIISLWKSLRNSIITQSIKSIFSQRLRCYIFRRFLFGENHMKVENVQIMTSSELRTQLQTMDDHVILTIVLTEGDDDDAKE